jgi:hypothetical protein
MIFLPSVFVSLSAPERNPEVSGQMDRLRRSKSLAANSAFARMGQGRSDCLGSLTVRSVAHRVRMLWRVEAVPPAQPWDLQRPDHRGSFGANLT